MSEPEDQTEAELEKTRRVVAASMAEQIATNDAAAHEDAVEEDAEPVSDEKPAAKTASKSKGI
jgi:hypothetical protein